MNLSVLVSLMGIAMVLPASFFLLLIPLFGVFLWGVAVIMFVGPIVAQFMPGKKTMHCTSCGFKFTCDENRN